MEPRRVRQGSVVQGRRCRRRKEEQQLGARPPKSAFRGERGGRHASRQPARDRPSTWTRADGSHRRAPRLGSPRGDLLRTQGTTKLGRTDPTEATAFGGERGTAAGAETPTRGRASARARPPSRRAYRLPAVAGRVSDRRGPPAPLRKPPLRRASVLWSRKWEDRIPPRDAAQPVFSWDARERSRASPACPRENNPFESSRARATATAEFYGPADDTRAAAEQEINDALP